MNGKANGKFFLPLNEFAVFWPSVTEQSLQMSIELNSNGQKRFLKFNEDASIFQI